MERLDIQAGLPKDTINSKGKVPGNVEPKF